MRKASALTTLVLLGGFAMLFYLADTSLRPLAKDGRVGQDLSRLLQHRGDLEAGSKMRVRRIRAASSDLATEGQGLRLHMVPSESVKTRRQGMKRLALRAAEAALDAYRGRAPDWVEATFQIQDGEPPRVVRVLLGVTPAGLRRESPALPLTWPPLPARGAPGPGPKPALAPAPTSASASAPKPVEKDA